MIRRIVVLCLLSLAGAPLLLAGCTFTAYEKELAVSPPEPDESPVATLATMPVDEEGWMQFLDFNHIVDSIVELFKHTTAKEAIRNGVGYTERKRLLHLELRQQERAP
jgi:hypothetical protein